MRAHVLSAVVPRAIGPQLEGGRYLHLTALKREYYAMTPCLNLTPGLAVGIFDM